MFKNLYLSCFLQLFLLTPCLFLLRFLCPCRSSTLCICCYFSFHILLAGLVKLILYRCLHQFISLYSINYISVSLLNDFFLPYLEIFRDLCFSCFGVITNLNLSRMWFSTHHKTSIDYGTFNIKQFIVEHLILLTLLTLRNNMSNEQQQSTTVRDEAVGKRTQLGGHLSQTDWRIEVDNRGNENCMEFRNESRRPATFDKWFWGDCVIDSTVILLLHLPLPIRGGVVASSRNTKLSCIITPPSPCATQTDVPTVVAVCKYYIKVTT